MNVREQILASDDLPRERVLVPEWGSDGKPLELFVRTLTGTERDAVEQAALKERAESEQETIQNIRARLVVFSAVDEAGTLVFSADDIEALGCKSAKALDRLFDVAARLSGFSDKDVEELAKNSERTSSEDSTSA